MEDVAEGGDENRNGIDQRTPPKPSVLARPRSSHEDGSRILLVVTLRQWRLHAGWVG